MTAPEVQDLVDRSREELGAARKLVESGFMAQAIAHAYYAAFFSAEAGLLALGETRSKHSGVISAFGERVVKSRGFDSAVASTLRKLFEVRNRATYDNVPVDDQTAAAAITDAEQFVSAVERWLAQRP